LVFADSYSAAALALLAQGFRQAISHAGMGGTSRIFETAISTFESNPNTSSQFRFFHPEP
jgi:hypothetical protein